MRLAIFLAAAVSLSACMSSNRSMAGDRPMAGDAMAMTDADILKVFMTSNDGEIVTSQAVVGDAQNADVRRFAQMMIIEHTALNERATALGLDPRDNLVSMSMRQNAQAKAREIDAAGSMQDMTYVETQVVLHGNTLDMLNNVLIPGARDPELRALLTEARPSVEQHFREAQRMHAAMM